MSKKIVLITCVAPKKEYKCSARELYQGDLFQQLLDFAEEVQPDKTFILSGKHHLLALETEIAPYDVNLNLVTEKELQEWSKQVLKQLQANGCNIKRDYFYILTNETYRRYLVKNINHFEVPFHID